VSYLQVDFFHPVRGEFCRPAGAARSGVIDLYPSQRAAKYARTAKTGVEIEDAARLVDDRVHDSSFQLLGCDVCGLMSLVRCAVQVFDKQPDRLRRTVRVRAFMQGFCLFSVT